MLYLISHFFVLAACVLFILTTIPLIKGAPFVPTPMRKVREMLKLANIKSGETVMDLGSGDGRFLVEAEKTYNAKAIGFELSPALYAYTCIRKWLGRHTFSIFMKSFRKASINEADVIICYLLPERMKEFESWFKKELKPGARVISNTFPFPNWQPTHQENKVFLYHI